MVAAAVVAAGAAASIAGSAMASDSQTSANKKAIGIQENYYGKAQDDLSPYMDLGKQGANALGSRLEDLTKPVTMDEATLQQTPGYQWNLNQGLKSVQNSAAARGLGTSGAALKGAATFASGLADSTYQNQFTNAVTNQTNSFNRLMGVTQLGQTSAGQLAGLGVRTGEGEAGTQVGIGNAQAAGWNSGAAGVGGAAYNYPMMKNLLTMA
jgi:hypothetical protein